MALLKLFIGSSTEGLPVATHLQLGLEYDADCTIWQQGIFEPSGTTLDSLVRATRDTDFAALVLTPDDMLTKRGKNTVCPRDNVIFELGLFMGVLGRERTFMVYCRNELIELPSDMAGITAVTFARRSDGNVQAALGPVCTKIKLAMTSHGRRRDTQTDELLERLLVLRYVNEQELEHLRRLDGRMPFDYERTAVFEAELRRLRDIGLVRTVGNRTIGSMPGVGNGHDYLEITDEGRAYIAMRNRVERDESLSAFAAKSLEKTRPWVPKSS